MPRLSIVIPALNAAATLGPVVEALGERAAADLAGELIVVDGGSSDGTSALARSAGALVVAHAASRGGQLARGAETAQGEWLLFLHADSRLEPGWSAAAARFVAQAEGEERAAVFRLALDDASKSARRMERLVAWRTKALGLPYGDQGLLIASAV